MKKNPHLGIWKSSWLTLRLSFFWGEVKEETEVQYDSFMNKTMEDREELSSIPKHASI